MNIPTTQKAWLVVKKGGPDIALHLAGEAPVLYKLKSREVLVKLHAGALNPL